MPLNLGPTRIWLLQTFASLQQEGRERSSSYGLGTVVFTSEVLILPTTLHFCSEEEWWRGRRPPKIFFAAASPPLPSPPPTPKQSSLLDFRPNCPCDNLFIDKTAWLRCLPACVLYVCMHVCMYVCAPVKWLACGEGKRAGKSVFFLPPSLSPLFLSRFPPLFPSSKNDSVERLGGGYNCGNNAKHNGGTFLCAISGYPCFAVREA